MSFPCCVRSIFCVAFVLLSFCFRVVSFFCVRLAFCVLFFDYVVYCCSPPRCRFRVGSVLFRDVFLCLISSLFVVRSRLRVFCPPPHVAVSVLFSLVCLFVLLFPPFLSLSCYLYLLSLSTVCFRNVFASFSYCSLFCYSWFCFVVCVLLFDMFVFSCLMCVLLL